MAAHQPQSARRRLLRNRRQIWFAGVCGGLSDYFGLHAGLIRLAFVVAALSGGFGVVAYLVLWIAMPMEPDRGEHAADQAVPGLRKIAIGIALISAAFALQLVLADGRTFALGWGVLVAPAIVAVAAAGVRGGRTVAWLGLATLGVGMTVLLAALNYEPTVGGRSEQPTSPVELTRGYSNAFGTMIIDLAAMNPYSGNLRLKANSVFGDVIVRVPPGIEVRDDGVVHAVNRPHLTVTLDISSLFGSVEVVRKQP